MIKHFVFLKYVENVSSLHVDEFCERMRQLDDLIPELSSLEIGRDILRESRSWDVILIMTFSNLESLRVYQQNPEHLAVMKFNQPEVAEVGSVDFETD